MKWITRQRPQVDRIACPWLITRFVDPDAEILYVAGDQVIEVAEREGATPFDVPGVELGHRGDECSFDAIVRAYKLASDKPALEHLARIVRGADTANHDLTPESRGLLAIAQGFSLAYADDHAQLAAELPVYDALYAWCQQQASHDTPATAPERVAPR
ncbi:MAG TPA: chromate resistance protein ChrB domain-containing protein [Chloroflexota bacterium]